MVEPRAPWVADRINRFELDSYNPRDPCLVPVADRAVTLDDVVSRVQPAPRPPKSIWLRMVVGVEYADELACDLGERGVHVLGFRLAAFNANHLDAWVGARHLGECQFHRHRFRRGVRE